MLRFVRCSNKIVCAIALIFIMLFSSLNIPHVAADSNRPDLIVSYANFPGNVTEGNNVEFVVEIENIVNGETGEYGNISSGVSIVVALLIDGNVVTTNSTSNGLNVGQSCYVNLSWTATLGLTTQRIVSIYVDYPQTIPESNENNNAWDGFINVYEKGPILEITAINIPSNIVMNKNTRITVDVKNNGGATTDPIYAKLNSSEDGQVETVVNQSSLPRNGTCTFSFDWTPLHFGSQEITVDIVYDGKTHDFENRSVVVGIDQLQWWNESWHYMYFLSVNGSGNVSKFFNFTGVLNGLGVFSQTFENDTIRIVGYAKNGSIIGEIGYYKFNESVNFDNVSNATGTLIWNVTGNSSEKYYGVYFDVSINIGPRTVLNETQNISESGNASVGLFSFAEGWQMNLLRPLNGSFSLVNQSVNINVSTMAKTENISAYIFLNTNESHNFTIYLSNIGNYTFWYGSLTFDQEGNWTIRVLGNDWAGYESTPVECAFFVGKPDVAIEGISFTVILPPGSPNIYRNDTVNITADVVSYYANIAGVNVSLSIRNLTNGQLIYTNFTNITIFKDITNYVSFIWKANVSGDLNVTITLDPDNVIDEQNESNNQLSKTMTVYELPDLEIINITLPNIQITELDKVEIDVTVANEGLGNAVDYELVLYIEQGIMTYSNMVDSSLVSVDANSSKTVSLYWDSAQPGSWLVGANVIVTDTNRDANILNNRLLSSEILNVRSIDRNPPIISNIQVSPTYQEQGGSVALTADIVDDTGIESVTIDIISPSGDLYDDTMVRTTGDEFGFTFGGTLDVGTYNFSITAVDISIHRNTATKNSSFYINEDSQPPVISYFDAIPAVQLKDDHVTITCIASDNIGISDVTVTITPPSALPSAKDMDLSNDGKYVYNDTYSVYGKYSFYITVKDEAGNTATSDRKNFWITSNLNDTDNDGMPDSWEKEYGLNPYDPSDAGMDPDGDGYTNIQEYNAGTNPIKDIFTENAAHRIEDNAWYIGASILLFLIVIILAFIGKRRVLL